MDSITTFTTKIGMILSYGIVRAVIVALVGMAVISFVMQALTRVLRKSHLEPAAHSLIKSVAKTGLYGILIYTVADQMNVDLTGILAIASVVTLAVSLSLQTALSNVVGGLMLLVNSPFKAGDFVEVEGQSGTVMEVGITYTRLRTLDNKRISLPNSAISGAQIVNYSTEPTRRVDIPASASYDADVETVLEALKEAADLPQTLSDPAVFTGVTEYGDNAISYTLRFWVHPEDYWDAYFAAQRKLKQVFDAHGIEMTYPHLNVHIQK